MYFVNDEQVIQHNLKYYNFFNYIKILLQLNKIKKSKLFDINGQKSAKMITKYIIIIIKRNIKTV